MNIKENSNSTRGLVLLNLGTPDSPEVQDVRKYLKEFLMDPYVLDVPYIVRWLIVHFAILPKRPAASAAAYQKIWTERGSPLSFHLSDLCGHVQECMGSEWIVKPAMRYGKPTIRKALEELIEKGVKQITLAPLYPQYSSAATESSVKECERILKSLSPNIEFEVVKPFYSHDLFIESFAQVAEKSLKGYSFDHILFSFHGLPERQVKRTDQTNQHCLSANGCCDKVGETNSNCYRAQCYSTAQLMANRLGILQNQYTVCFQSRLGRTPWIRPFTDEFYRELPKRGVRKLAVVCPSFVADCLETLEEVQMRGREEFIRHGGEDLLLVPSLNASQAWAKGISEIALGN